MSGRTCTAPKDQLGCQIKNRIRGHFARRKNIYFTKDLNPRRIGIKEILSPHNPHGAK
jgi:hypothetical protein